VTYGGRLQVISPSTVLVACSQMSEPFGIEGLRMGPEVYGYNVECQIRDGSF